MPLAFGTSLGPYKIEGSHGVRGMCEVHKARDTRLDRTVAITVHVVLNWHEELKRLAQVDWCF